VNTVILGATGGIGEALARTLPGPLVLSARNAKALRELARELGAYDVPADVSKELELHALAEETRARGGVKILIYAVGDIAPGSIAASERGDMERIWNANALGFQLALKHLGPQLEPDARVYAIGARPELITYPGFAAYASAKAALGALCRVAQLELKRPVTLVLPPAVNTAFWQRLGKPAPRDAIDASVLARAIVMDLVRAPSQELRVP
jgi:cyclic-di-GMP-binding biofilm dispersal mediator protein